MIRRSVRNGCCGPANANAVRALVGIVALTARGKVTLERVAADYQDAAPEWTAACGCDRCARRNLEALT